MSNYNNTSRMPPKEKTKKKVNDDDDSVDSNGNIANLVDYEYSSNGSDKSDESEESEESESDESTNVRPTRKAAIDARKKINRIIKKECKEYKHESKKVNNITPTKRKFPFKIPKSNVSTESESESEEKGFGSILLSLSGMPGNIMQPKKYNMKKESEIVKKFVKLLTTPVENNTIDNQIDQFKKLDSTKQNELIAALENRTANDSGVNLMLKILTLKLQPDVQSMILAKYNSLQGLDVSSNEYFKLRSWLDKVVSIPFGTYKDIPVNIDNGSEKCTEFMKGAKKCLDDAIYGQEDSKLQIMQFISTKITNPAHRGLSLLLVGPPGIGKTQLIKNGIAKSLDWPFQFISLGGDSDASTYTGHQLVYESSHCGKIVNSLIASKSMSTVLMFDELDKISQTPKGEEVMNLLIHLTDSVQNGDFEDKYLSGVPLDLSKVMFVFSANDINKIDKILLDRMMVIDLKGYDLKQKTIIAENYLLPSAIKDVNLHERISISKDILTYIIEEYAGTEKGVRELKRCIEQVTQKINMLRIYNSTELPFHIKDFSLPFIVKKEHIKLFLKKKDITEIPFGMYS